MAKPFAHRRAALSSALAVAVALTLTVPSHAFAQSTVPAAPTAPAPAPAPGVDEAADDGSAVPDEERDEKLGGEWRTSEDVAWTATGDADSFRILRAAANTGYEWSEVAALSVAGYETDRWIGNACLMSDTVHLAVVYAPRWFIDTEELFMHGGFSALVDITTGEVQDLGSGYSLSYFSPACGVDNWVTFSRFSSDGISRFESMQGAQVAATDVVEVNSLVTSAVMTEDGLLAATESAIVRVGDDGGTVEILETDGAASSLQPTPEGLAFLDAGADAEHTSVNWVDADAPSEAIDVSVANDSPVDLLADTDMRVHVVGVDADVDLPDGMVGVNDLAATELSSKGDVAVDSVLIGQTAEGTSAPTVAIDARSLVSGAELNFEVDVEAQPAENQLAPEAPASGEPLGNRANAVPSTVGLVASTADVPAEPWSSGSPCAVSRNHPNNQALQPRPAQIEWAVNQAIRGNLLETRAAGWRNLGMPSYSPQGLFPLPALSGGGRVPAQVLLGILAQESNLWQASKVTVPGVTGNPLIGNYYGWDRGSDDPAAWWQVHYEDADCGYGVGQVTDGMRAGEMPLQSQRAIALDYEANIARSLQILIGKWNETRAAGLVINDGNPARIENWFFALWAYNSGFKSVPDQGRWGVGWLNNPANPLYPLNRTSFLDGEPGDAAHPQDWPYSEKVLGFAAHSLQLLDNVNQGALGDTFTYKAAFTPAWWPASDGNNGVTNRKNVKPPVYLFCDGSNLCNPAMYNTADGQDPGPCLSTDADGWDFKCWFHEPATWKTDCNGQCGYESLVYSLASARPANAGSYPANCTTTGLPAGALIVDSVPSGTAPVRDGCAAVPTSGSFQFYFADHGTGTSSPKVDLHQLGSGFNGQFYFSRTRVPETNAHFDGALDIRGKWTLGQPLNGWAQVYVHMPNHAAWLQQATYKISTGLDTVERSVGQRTFANTWVSLGTLQFNGTPSVELDNNPTSLYALSGSDDVAWDAVAFVPLAQKPTDFVVSLGDSYSSGEGTSPTDGSGFLRGTDFYSGDEASRNACHRSYDAWPYKIDLPGVPGTDTLRGLVASQDPRVDHQFLACSGAETYHVDGVYTDEEEEVAFEGGGAGGRYDELPQVERGFLDNNTTLVTLSIGGNDVGFSTLIQHCMLGTWLPPGPCKDVPAPAPGTGTTGEYVKQKTNDVSVKVFNTLEAIHAKAPYARILLLGYPMLFETGSTCAGISSDNIPWLRQVSLDLNQALSQAAFLANSYTVYQDPQYRFAGSNLCTANPGIRGLEANLTPGDKPIINVPVEGSPDKRVGVSAQSIHPTMLGSAMYGEVANTTLRMTRTNLSAGIAGGYPTTYYATFRLHDGGTASMNVSSFSACGEELRIGLRKSPDGTQQVTGQQHTNSLAWRGNHGIQTFTWQATTPHTTDLPAGYYAVNARLLTGCSSGTSQSWAGQLQW